MAEFPALFKISDVKSFLSGNDSVDLNLEYLNTLLITYKEIYSHNSDYDIDAYIKKHKIKFLIYKGTILRPKIDSIVDLIDFKFLDFSHLSTYYKNFQYQMLLLIQFVEKEISDLVFLKTIFDDNFKICFDKDELFIIMHSFGDDNCSALDWLENEYEKILSVINHYSVPLFEKIHSKYCVADNGRSLYDKIPIYRSSMHQSFLEKLQNVLLPAIEYFINELDYKVTLEMALFNYDLLKEDDSEKFPLFNYDFCYINSFCESVFRSVEEKIEYISYALLKINMSHCPDPSTADCFKSFISPFKQKLAHLKTVYQINHNKETPPTPNIDIDTSCLVDGIKQAIEPLANLNGMKSICKIIPKRKQDTILIKHYIAIALEAEDVPMLKQLATEEFSVSFWCKKFLDIYFVTKLLKDIESKIKSGKINDKNHDLYIKLREDVTSKIPKATDSERNKTGWKNKKSPAAYDNLVKEKNIFEGDDSFNQFG